MNIFFLHKFSTSDISKDLVNKHIVKMPLESAQMLCTAHRLLDGHRVEYIEQGRLKRQWLLQNESMGALSQVYKVAHSSHPCTIWTMQNRANYEWHFQLLCDMLNEYTFRYGRTHSVNKLLLFLENAPENIDDGDFCPPPLAMPEFYKDMKNPDSSYQQFYAGEKWRFAKWHNRDIPEWFIPTMEQVWFNESFENRKMQLEIISNKRTPPLDKQILNKAILLSL